MTGEEREQQKIKERRAFAKALSESFTKPYADAVANITEKCIENYLKEKKENDRKEKCRV